MLYSLRSLLSENLVRSCHPQISTPPSNPSSPGAISDQIPSSAIFLNVDWCNLLLFSGVHCPLYDWLSPVWPFVLYRFRNMYRTSSWKSLRFQKSSVLCYGFGFFCCDCILWCFCDILLLWDCWKNLVSKKLSNKDKFSAWLVAKWSFPELLFIYLLKKVSILEGKKVFFLKTDIGHLPLVFLPLRKTWYPERNLHFS